MARNSMRSRSVELPENLRGTIRRELKLRNPGVPEGLLADLAGIMTAVGEVAATLPVKGRKRAAAHPDRIRAALSGAFAQDAATAPEPERMTVGARMLDTPEGTGLGEILALEEGRARLDSLVRPMPMEDWAGEVLGPVEIGACLGIARSTLDAWRRRGEVVALPKGIRGHVYPITQFRDMAPLPGIRAVLQAASSNARVAWRWLTTPHSAFGGTRPIDRLAADDTDRVVLAAVRDLG